MELHRRFISAMRMRGDKTVIEWDEDTVFI